MRFIVSISLYNIYIESLWLYNEIRLIDKYLSYHFTFPSSAKRTVSIEAIREWYLLCVGYGAKESATN